MSLGLWQGPCLCGQSAPSNFRQSQASQDNFAYQEQACVTEPLMEADLLHAGVIQENGMVKCAQHVGGPQNHECSLSEFEKLGNSKERRPGENIHLTTFSLALKVVKHPFLIPAAFVMHMAGSCIHPVHYPPLHHSGRAPF